MMKRAETYTNATKTLQKSIMATMTVMRLFVLQWFILMPKWQSVYWIRAKWLILFEDATMADKLNEIKKVLSSKQIDDMQAEVWMTTEEVAKQLLLALSKTPKKTFAK
jgi:hypothetical protein